MLPVKSLTTEYYDKKDIKVYATIWENGRRSSEKVILVSDTRNPAILMYASEVFDINGKLIYEGDILHAGKDIEECERAVVFYNKGIFSADYFSKAPPSSANGNTNAWWGEGWEPDLLRRSNIDTRRFRMRNIGNICENPELLGQSIKDIEKLKSIYDWNHEE